jgi:hypothetical protein
MFLLTEFKTRNKHQATYVVPVSQDLRWQCCSFGFPLGFALGKSLGAALPALGKLPPSVLFYLD